MTPTANLAVNKTNLDLSLWLISNKPKGQEFAIELFNPSKK
jgi:hypothetical protein